MSRHPKQGSSALQNVPASETHGPTKAAATLRLAPVDPRRLALFTLGATVTSPLRSRSLEDTSGPSAAGSGGDVMAVRADLPRVHRVQRELRRRPAGRNEYLDIRITWLLDGSTEGVVPALSGGRLTLN